MWTAQKIIKFSKSIRARLTGGVLLYMMVLVIIGVLFNQFSSTYNSLLKVRFQLDSLNLTLKDIQINAQNFSNYELIKPSFYQKKESPYQVRHTQLLDKTHKLIHSLQKHPQLREKSLQKEIKLLEQDLPPIKLTFDSLLDANLERGFQDYGLIGDMRRLIHPLEDPRFNIPPEKILSLRRHEKDYLLRKQKQYIEKLDRALLTLKEELNLGSIRTNQSEEILSRLDQYQKTFLEVVALDKRIGVDRQGGLKANLDARIEHFNQQSTQLSQRILNLSQHKQSSVNYVLSFLFFSFLFFSIALIYWVFKKFAQPVYLLSKSIRQVIEANFDRHTKINPIKSRDELGRLSKDVQHMLENVQHYTQEILAQKDELMASEEELRQNVEELHATKEALAEREAEAQSILDAIRRGAIVEEYGLDAQVLSVNQNFLDALGLEEEKVLGKKCWEVAKTYPNGYEADEHVFEGMWQEIKQGKHLNMECKLEVADNSIWMGKTYAPIYDEKRNIRKIISIGQDISQRRLQQEEIMRQKGEIEAQNKILETFNAQLKSKETTLNKAIHKYKETQRSLQKNNKELELKDRSIQQSIRAAYTIQKAILPYEAKLNSLLKDYFIINRPKDVVSGDFFWLNEVEGRKFLVMVDCTGHGVPGAFMSLIGNTLLDKIIRVRKVLDPAQILEALHEDIYAMLQQDSINTTYGMDMSILAWEPKDEQYFKVIFAGAKQNTYCVKSWSQSIEIIKGDRRSIGGQQNTEIRFKNREMFLPADTYIYLGSDGLEDQNDVQRKKFGAKRIRGILEEHMHLPIQEQKKFLESALEKHMEGTSQRDDILLIGVRI